MPFKLGPMELVIILSIVLIIFGAGKLPQIGGAMGKAIRQFKHETVSEDQEAPRRRSASKKGAQKLQA